MNFKQSKYQSGTGKYDLGLARLYFISLLLNQNLFLFKNIRPLILSFLNSHCLIPDKESIHIINNNRWLDGVNNIQFLSSGHYVYLESSWLRPGDRILMKTPELLTSGPDCKFEFWYHMNGDSIGNEKFYFTEIICLLLRILSSGVLNLKHCF